MLSIVLIAPAEHVARANMIAVAMGYADPGVETYVVRLSADGQEPATHYGCHTWGTPTFAQILAGAQSGTLPDVAWSSVGLTGQQAADVIASLLTSVRPDGGHVGHFDAVCAANGLTKIKGVAA